MRIKSLASGELTEFYRCIVEDEGRASAAPMLELARRLRQRPYAADVSGGTSLEHMALGSIDGDSIVIGYSAETDLYGVTYFDSRINRHTKQSATPDQIDSLIDALIQRLLLSQH